MICEECNNYIPSKKIGGGRCKHLKGAAKYPQDHCSAKMWKDVGEKELRLVSMYEPIKANAIPDESGLGEDPQVTYKA